MYFLLMYEGWRNLSLGISKVMKEFQFAYVSDRAVVTVLRNHMLSRAKLLLFGTRY